MELAAAELAKRKTGNRPQEIAQASAALAQQQANFAKARADYERRKPLLETEAISKALFDQTEAAFLAAQVQVEAQKQVCRCCVRARVWRISQRRRRNSPVLARSTRAPQRTLPTPCSPRRARALCSRECDREPIINGKQYVRVNGFINDSVASGILVSAQGQLAPGLPAGGYFVKPTLFGGVPRDHNLACKEVSAPVLSAMPFSDEEDAVQLANSTEFGLVAGVWTENGSRQARLAQRIQSGQVFINCYGAGGGVELPFGGMKKSGHGREKGFLAPQEMSTTKSIVEFN